MKVIKSIIKKLMQRHLALFLLIGTLIADIGVGIILFRVLSSVPFSNIIRPLVFILIGVVIIAITVEKTDIGGSKYENNCKPNDK